MNTMKVLLNETIYRTKTYYLENNTLTRYRTWGIYEYSIKDDEKIIGRMVDMEDNTDEICVASLKPEQVNEITEKGFWQCLHNGKKCAQITV